MNQAKLSDERKKHVHPRNRVFDFKEIYTLGCGGVVSISNSVEI